MKEAKEILYWKKKMCESELYLAPLKGWDQRKKHYCIAIFYCSDWSNKIIFTFLLIFAWQVYHRIAQKLIEQPGYFHLFE